MKRINQLLHHSDFIQTLEKLEILEADRIYCHHGLSHLLDVARIACLLQYNQKEEIKELFSMEIIYASALLHDIGRVLQYEQGLPHETAGLLLAQKILNECNFTKSEQNLILKAILFHRKEIKSNIEIKDNTIKNIEALHILLYKADKLSRNCFFCKAADTCYWSNNEKNKGILF